MMYGLVRRDQNGDLSGLNYTLKTVIHHRPYLRCGSAAPVLGQLLFAVIDTRIKFWVQSCSGLDRLRLRSHGRGIARIDHTLGLYLGCATACELGGS